MGFSPIQFFRKEDFPELKKETWAERLFTKLNELARQLQSTLSNNITVEQNLSAFWWEGTVVQAAPAAGIYVPHTYVSFTAPTVRAVCTTRGWPFIFPNKLAPKKVKAVIAAQALDISNAAQMPVAALCLGVGWTEEEGNVRIAYLHGLSPNKNWFVRLLVLCE